MFKRMISIQLISISVLLSQSCTLAIGEGANSLYQQGEAMERQGRLGDALALYKRICSEFPNDTFAGPDNADYRAKLVACRIELEKGDVASAKEIAEQIRTLPSSVEQKPEQLYSTGCSFDTKKLFSDALSFYQQLLSEYPNSRFAGPDYTGYNIKRIAYGQALESGDIVEARKIADEIRNLASSPEEKPAQLYSTGYLFEAKKLFSDALPFYQDINGGYPDSQFAGANYAGFKAKEIALMMSLESGDIVEARKIADKIRTLASSPEEKPAQLFWTGQLFEEKELYADAVTFYQQCVKEDSKVQRWETECAKLHLKMGAFQEAVERGELSAAKQFAAPIIAENAGRPILVRTLFVIGEKYYLAGQKRDEKEFLEESARVFKDMFDANVIGLDKISRKDYESSGWYILGLNYQQLGDYQKAANAFAKSYAMDPKFIYADYCLYAVGNCYEKLLIEEKINGTEAKAKIRSHYDQLLSDYPESSYAQFVNDWLKDNQ